MNDDVTRPEPRIPSIEADVSQLNARVANVEIELRGFGKSINNKLDIMDARFQNEADTHDQWRFLILLALLSVTVTLEATILAVLLSGLHGH